MPKEGHQLVYGKWLTIVQFAWQIADALAKGEEISREQALQSALWFLQAIRCDSGTYTQWAINEKNAFFPEYQTSGINQYYLFWWYTWNLHIAVCVIME